MPRYYHKNVNLLGFNNLPRANNTKDTENTEKYKKIQKIQKIQNQYHIIFIYILRKRHSRPCFLMIKIKP